MIFAYSFSLLAIDVEAKQAPAVKAKVSKEVEVKHNVTLQSDVIFNKLSKILQGDESK